MIINPQKENALLAMMIDKNQLIEALSKQVEQLTKELESLKEGCKCEKTKETEE
jgi:hypothetical protein